MKIQSEHMYLRYGEDGAFKKAFRLLRLSGYTANGAARFIVHVSNFNRPSELSSSDTEEAYRQAEARAKVCFAKGYKPGGYVERPDGTKRYEYFSFGDYPGGVVERMEEAFKTSI